LGTTRNGSFYMENTSSFGNGINETISKIKGLSGEYDPESNLSLQDQLLICESVAESTQVSYDSFKEQDKLSENVSVNGNVNGSYKHDVNSTLTQSKHQVITKLRACTYRTSPKEVASLLEQLFNNPDTQKDHWLYVAQHWPPRRINYVLASMTKQHQRGVSKIQNPSSYFTFLIKRRQKRKIFRNINGTREHRESSKGEAA